MNPFRHQILNQPTEDQYLWRYIKADRIQSFLDGEIYFSPLHDFDDFYESIEPLHYFIHSFAKRALHLKFDLSKQLNELPDSESVLGNMLMWVALYDIEKKISMITGITDEKELTKKIMEYGENMSQFIKPHLEFHRQHYSSCWFVGDCFESALMWTAYSKPGGVAVRIKFSDFKTSIQKYFENQFADPFLSTGIQEIFAGLITYKDYNDATEWFKDIKAGIPRPFFKQHFYRQENEFRILIKRQDNFSDSDFNRLHQIVDGIQTDIILHPTATPDDLQKMKSKVADKKHLRIRLSDMDFNRNTGANSDLYVNQ